MTNQKRPTGTGEAIAAAAAYTKRGPYPSARTIYNDARNAASKWKDVSSKNRDGKITSAQHELRTKSLRATVHHTFFGTI